MKAAHIWIVSPALADANNGNWQSAKRWAHFLRPRYRVTLATQWPDPASTADQAAADAPDLLIALHARRSSASLAAYTHAYPERPTLLLLTGTDLYRDIRSDGAAQAALVSAQALVLLQAAGLDELAKLQSLSPTLCAKASVIYQSAATLKSATLSQRFFDVAMIGHLRVEKDPLTFMRAGALIKLDRVRLIHIGAALEPELGELARATEATSPRYRWLGSLPHAQTRQRLKHCHLMAITSQMEGGANVIIEAVTSGVAVVASDISGNRGMLGDDYAGYFPAGDCAALAALIERCALDASFHQLLQKQCAARAALFTPEAEQTALLDLVDNLLQR